MRATTIMVIAIALGLVGRWAHNEHVTPATVVETMFAVLVIALLDQGNTEGIAKGFAWLFLAAVVLSNNSPVTALSKVSGGPAKPGTMPGIQVV